MSDLSQVFSDIEKDLAKKDDRTRKFTAEISFVVEHKEELARLIEEYSIKSVADQLQEKQIIKCGYNTFRSLLERFHVIEKKRMKKPSQESGEVEASVSA